ncbi:MAG TPA: AMP-binding protein [Acidimicrobiia bacterium]|nr:AMP-binding protein [Acidimicrobiia bacterium]
MSDWTFAGVWSTWAAEIPERDAIICGDTRRTWGELADRAGRLASFLYSEGLRPGDKVAIDLLNRPEYIETFFAALALGCAPVNINYRYGVNETHYVVDDSDAKVVIHEPDLAKTVHQAVRQIAKRWRPATLERGEAYEAAIADSSPDGPWKQRPPEGDDLILLYTGGTTGMPKGVMWRSDDLYVALWQMARPGTEPPDPLEAARRGKRAATALAACPLMHGTGLFISLSTLSGGGAVVLIDQPGLDVEHIWNEVERNDVSVLSIVGDVFARPLLGALEAEPDRWDLSSLRAISSSGVTWSPEVKRGLLDHLGRVTLLDSLGASEGMMTRSSSRAGDAEIAPARFAVNDRVRVLRESDDRDVTPGSDDVGMLAVGGRIPLGYYEDPVKTAKTFRTVDGTRFSIPGDYGSVEADGTIRLLGRGSATVNTGGEKVYPEEVELAMKKNRAVYDCVVVGVPDERFGERVVTLIQVAKDCYLDEAELRASTRRFLAGYKMPKQMLFVDSLLRAANGKADYPRLKQLAIDRIAEQGI